MPEPSGSVVHKKAVKLLECPASTVGFVKGDVGNATADRVGTVNEVDALNGADGLDKILLTGSVSVYCW